MEKALLNVREKELCVQCDGEWASEWNGENVLEFFFCIFPNEWFEWARKNRFNQNIMKIILEKTRIYAIYTFFISRERQWGGLARVDGDNKKKSTTTSCWCISLDQPETREISHDCLRLSTVVVVGLVHRVCTTRKWGEKVKKKLWTRGAMHFRRWSSDA